MIETAFAFQTDAIKLAANLNVKIGTLASKLNTSLRTSRWLMAL